MRIDPSASRRRGLLVCGAAYLCALPAAHVTAGLLGVAHPVLIAAAADVAAIVVVFCFSLGSDNASIYEPYWSAATALMLLLAFATSGYAGGQPAKDRSMPSKPAGSMEGGDKAMADPTTASDSRMAMSTGRKVMFTDLDAAQALAAKGLTLLLFAADWCPTCQAALEDINADSSRLGDITVVVANYDKATDLRWAFGVTYQRTFVWIDADAKAIATCNSGDVDNIVNHTAKTGSMK